MEEIRKAAKAVHSNLSVEARAGREGVFWKLDRDGDGKISLQEFMTLFHDNNVKASMNRMFKLADQNGNGKLQFDDYVTLLYMLDSQRPRCDGCGDFIGGLFFTCKLCCLGRNGDRSKTYDLCIPCYQGRLFVHDHSDFIDNYSLLATLQDVLSASATKENPPLSHPGYYSSTSSATAATPPLSRPRYYYSTTSYATAATAGQCYHYYPPIGRVQRKSGLEEVIDIAANFAKVLDIGDALSNLFSN